MPRYFLIAVLSLAFISCTPATSVEGETAARALGCFDGHDLTPCEVCTGELARCTGLVRAPVVYGAAAPLPQ
jgi:hypothetical protein